MPMVLAAIVSATFLAGDVAQAELLVEYTFDSDTSDSSGNGRDGDLDIGLDLGDGAGDPVIADGRLILREQF